MERVPVFNKVEFGEIAPYHTSVQDYVIARFTLGLIKWEGNFEQAGKVRENHTHYWKSQGISDKFIIFLSVI